MSKKYTMPQYLSDFAQDNNEELIMTANHGYVVAPQKILRCYRLNEIEKLVLFELLSYMGENNYAFPSHKRLAFKLGKKSVSSIKKALNTLKEKGFIEWTKGRGDIGSNRYQLAELKLSPYIILSEFVHFFTECILKMYRNEIAYEDIYGPILGLVEQQNYKNDEQDVYGICLEHLFKDRELMCRVDMYDLLAEHLLHRISIKTGVTLKINTFQLITEHFKNYHPHIVIHEEDHAIYQDLKGPNDSKEFEIVIPSMSEEALEIGRKEYARVDVYIENQDEYTIYKFFLYNLFLHDPSFTSEIEGGIEAFRELTEQEKIQLLQKQHPINLVKASLKVLHVYRVLDKLGMSPY